MIKLKILKSKNLYNSEHMCVWQLNVTSHRLVISIVITLNQRSNVSKHDKFVNPNIVFLHTHQFGYTIR